MDNQVRFFEESFSIPNRRISSWTDNQLVTLLADLSRLNAAYMDACKAECRKRVGKEGGKLIGGAHVATVAKEGDMREQVQWQALATSLLEGRQDKEELLAKFTERKPPVAQRVSVK